MPDYGLQHVPVLTTAALPPAGYVKIILRHGSARIDVHEHFVKQTIRNHYVILSANGPLTLTIPVLHLKRKMAVYETGISYAQPWQRQHIQALRSAYGRSPFFAFFFSELEQILTLKHEKLTDLNHQLLNWCMKCLGAEVSICFTGCYQHAYENDWRQASQKHSRIFEGVSAGLHYLQVFTGRFGFVSGLSIVDFIFNAANRSDLLR